MHNLYAQYVQNPVQVGHGRSTIFTSPSHEQRRQTKAKAQKLEVKTEAEAKISASRSLWPQGLNMTDVHVLSTSSMHVDILSKCFN